MIRMRALLAVIVFFGLATCAQATAIIAFWSPDAVYIGADSRETSPNQAPREICKIRIAGDVVVAEAGWLEDINDGIVVESIDKVIKNEFGKSGSVPIHIDSIDAWARNKIERIVGDRTKIPPIHTIGLFFAYPDVDTMKTDFIAAVLMTA